MINIIGLTKTREEIIFELLLSLNRSNSGCIEDRVEYAIEQYEQLEKDYKKEREKEMQQ